MFHPVCPHKATHTIFNNAAKLNASSSIKVYKYPFSHKPTSKVPHSKRTATSLPIRFGRTQPGGELKLRKNKTSSYNNIITQAERPLPLIDQTEQQMKEQDDSPSSFDVNPSEAISGLATPQRESWQIQKAALKQKFGKQGWAPRKRLSPDALEGIRLLHKHDPFQNSTEALAGQFQVSPEVIRRILKSKWKPSEEEELDRRRRWNKRGEQIWSQMVELGVKPPKKWREMGVAEKTPEKPTAMFSKEPNKRWLKEKDGSDSLDITMATTTASEPAEQLYETSLSHRIL